MTVREQEILLVTARETIQSRLEQRKPLYEEPTPAMLEPYALFVTLHTNGRLRGCIGTLEAAKPLFEAVKDYSISSAFSDPRFPALSIDELPDMSLEISVLTPLKKVDSLEKIVIGKHGLYAKQGLRTGVLLPQVPVEQGWDREQFLNNTCRKAGLSTEAWKTGDVEFYSFEAEIFGEEN